MPPQAPPPLVVAVPGDPAPGRAGDLVVAALLAIAAVFILVRTNDMGFVRDEAFYFGHAEGYQDWFVRVEAGEETRQKALERRAIVDTWLQNSEHPPLDKILFGWSWRALGRKLRPLQNFRTDDGHILVDVTDLGPSHGFAVGARVRLLAPQEVGKPSDPDGREIQLAEVVERQPHRAVLRLPPSADLTKLQGRCLSAGPAPAQVGVPAVIRRTSCEALERRILTFLSESDALRFPGAIFGGLLVGILYLAARLWFAGRATAAGPGLLRRPFALAAAIGYLCLPQPFWNAHLCTFDTTITALLLLTTFAWHRSLRSAPWVWLTAVLWGISLLAKHNALFLPVPLALHWLWDGVAEGRLRLTRDPASGTTWWRSLALLALAAVLGILVGVRVHPLAGLALALVILGGKHFLLHFPPVPSAFFAMLPIGLVILVAGWPLLWVDTAQHFLRWIEFHLHHEHYMQVFFGRVLAYPPFPPEFPWVMTLLTWPVSLLAAFAVGLVAVYAPRRWPRLRAGLQQKLETFRGSVPQPFAAWSRAEAVDGYGRSAELRSHDRLVLLSVLWPMALISMPGTPIFGGTKHWMLAYPFMLLIGARGAQAVWQRLVAAANPSAEFAEVDLTLRPGSTEAQLALLQHRPGPRPGLLRAAVLPRLLALVLVLAMLVPAAQVTADAHPHGSAWYNELIGGIPGAAEAGMQRQFWGGSTRDGLDEINRRAPKDATIWFHKSAWGAFVMYQREGWLRRDLRYGGDPNGTALGLYHHQKDHDDFELDAIRAYSTRVPVLQSALEGVPILSVYEKASAPPTPSERPAAVPGRP